jgi:hypothetical protein
MFDDDSHTMNPTNLQSNFNAAPSENVMAQPNLQSNANQNCVAPGHNAVLPALVLEQASNGDRLNDRLSLNVELADLMNIAAGIAGLYVAKKHCTSLLAGVLMAGPAQYLACAVPFIAKFKMLMSMIVSFLAGAIGCKNPYRFIMGYLTSKAACIGIGCACKLYSKYVG